MELILLMKRQDGLSVENIFVLKCNWMPYKSGLRKPFLSTEDIGSQWAKDSRNVDKNWDVNVLKDLFDNPIDSENIWEIYIPRFIGRDERVQRSLKNDQLTLKLAYILIVNRNEADPNPLVNWKDLWSISLPQRVLMFGWKCLKNAIPLRNIVKSKIK